jgi:hypothetical protein
METIRYFDRVKNEWVNIDLKEKVLSKNKGVTMNKDYDNRYTVRIHDFNLNKEFEEVYEQFKPAFKARNPFFVECIKRGLKDFKKEHMPLENKHTVDILLDRLQANMDKLNDISNFIFEKLGELEAYGSGLLKLASSNQNIILKLSEGALIDKQMLNLGMYDKTCKRIEDVMQEVLNNYKL